MNALIRYIWQTPVGVSTVGVFGASTSSVCLPIRFEELVLTDNLLNGPYRNIYVSGAAKLDVNPNYSMWL